MKASQLGEFLADGVSGYPFGTLPRIRNIRERLYEEGLLSKNNVQPVEAARLIIYSLVLPYVSKGLANDLIKEYEAEWKIDRGQGEGHNRSINDTSLGYLSRVLSGEVKSPHIVRIDRVNGDIWYDSKISGKLGEKVVQHAGYRSGIYAHKRVSRDWIVNEVVIPNIWIELLKEAL